MRDPRFYHLGLIGWPVAHSLSPQLHEAALRAEGLAGEYCLYPVPPPPEGLRAMEALAQKLRAGELAGLNVTIPHKRNIMDFLDVCSTLACAVGAVNTLFMEDGRLTGDNTDVQGFWDDLNRWAGSAGRHLPAAGTALVLGAGGAARAAVYALRMHGWNVVLAARRQEAAEALAADMLAALASPAALQVAALDAAGLGGVPAAVVVNASSAGMEPKVHESPWPAGLAWPAGVVVYDMVYKPRLTALVRQARAAGVPATHGLGMLVEQGALSFERWTGRPAPRAAMHRLFDKE
jgi:shikimate dehydrogenase